MAPRLAAIGTSANSALAAFDNLVGAGEQRRGYWARVLSGQARLELSDSNHLGHEEPTHSPGRDLWQITEDDVDTCVEQRQKKFRVAREPVELRDDQ